MLRAKEFVGKFDGEFEFSTAAWQGSQLQGIGPEALSDDEFAALEDLHGTVKSVYLGFMTANLRLLQTMVAIEDALGLPRDVGSR